MGRLFLSTGISVAAIVFLLFFPVFLEADVHYDMNRRKFTFALYAYKVLKIIGGYVTVYPGGVALHISDKKAVLLPYTGMEAERKRFSFVSTFRLVRFIITTETGAEYLLPVSAVHTALRVLFFSLGGEQGKIENNLWLTDGDELRVSGKLVSYFNLFMLLCALIKGVKEKLKAYGRKKQTANR